MVALEAIKRRCWLGKGLRPGDSCGERVQAAPGRSGWDQRATVLSPQREPLNVRTGKVFGDSCAH